MPMINGVLRNPGDTWKNQDGSVTTVQQDGTTYTTPTVGTMLGMPKGNPAAASIANLAGGFGTYKAVQGIAGSATPAAEAGMSSLAPSAIADSGMAGVPVASAAGGGELLGTASGTGYGGAAAPTGASTLGGMGAIAAGAYTGYQQYGGVKNAIAGKNLSGLQQAALALPTFGLSFLANPISSMTKSHTRGEQHQRDALIAQGINVPTDPNAQDGKHWEANPIFAQTRNEADLTGSDIKDASDFYAMIPNYSKFSDAQKEKTAQQALNMGIINESKGKINVGLQDSPQYQQWVTQMSQAVDSGSSGATSGTSSGGTSSADVAKAQKKQTAMSMLALSPEVTQGTRYDYGEIAKNPYARY